MNPHYIIIINGDPVHYLAQDLRDVLDRKKAYIAEYDSALAKVRKRFADAWPHHARLEVVPVEEMFAYYGRIGAKKKGEPKTMPGRKRAERPLQIMSGTIEGKQFYVCAHSLSHASELLHKLGLPKLRYWQIYRKLKQRKNFGFNPKLEPQVGVWRRGPNQWTQLL